MEICLTGVQIFRIGQKQLGKLIKESGKSLKRMENMVNVWLETFE